MKNISNDYPIYRVQHLASSSCCMIHEMRDPSYCLNLGSYSFENFSFDFFVLCWIPLDFFAKFPASQLGKRFFKVVFVVAVTLCSYL